MNHRPLMVAAGFLAFLAVVITVSIGATVAILIAK
jgi:hypothetical protein